MSGNEMRDEKRKLKTARLGIVALLILNVMWVGMLILARHQREQIVGEFIRRLDEQVEINLNNDDFVEKLMKRLKECDDHSKK